MSTPENFQGGFLKALLKDPTANTLVIGAASLVPLVAMVGGGIDASRYYMTQSRLQAACDAGALAARHAMDADTFTEDHREVGEDFFDQNYPDGTFGLASLNRSYSATDDGIVNGTASGTLPTSLMGMFGYEKFDLKVNCSADINISNTDIMFVFDVTGSMNCVAGDSTCGNNGNVEAEGSKIDALRAAALTFYDTVSSATANQAEVRYGILPYSSNVNVGSSLQTSWMRTNYEYNSREPSTIVESEWVLVNQEDTDRDSGNNGYPYLGTEEVTWTGVTYNQCVDYYYDYRKWDIFHDRNTASADVVYDDGTTRITELDGYIQWKVHWNEQSFNYDSSTDTCTNGYSTYTYYGWGETTVTERLEEEERFAWRYAPIEYNLANLYSNGSITANTGTNGSSETHTWNGCIEDADTVQTGTFDPVPAAAYDLDIDLVPNSDATRWRPQLASLYFFRYDKDGFGTRDEVTHEVDWHYHPDASSCPKAALRLQKMDERDTLRNYMLESNGFRARGSTYHDAGMLWGARFISPDGIFASDNKTSSNGDAVARHIVFMTDGVLDTSNSVYGLQGVEFWDRRVTSNADKDTMDEYHEARFQAACQAARNKNISVWVVAFDTDETDDAGNPVVPENLRDCATPGRAFLANNEEELKEKFKEIAEKIAALRLTA